MFPKLGMGELIIILLIVVVLFGANKLPQLGAGLGEGLKSLRKAFRETRDDEPAEPAVKSPPQPAPTEGQSAPPSRPHE